MMRKIRTDHFALPIPLQSHCDKNGQNIWSVDFVPLASCDNLSDLQVEPVWQDDKAWKLLAEEPIKLVRLRPNVEGLDADWWHYTAR